MIADSCATDRERELGLKSLRSMLLSPEPTYIDALEQRINNLEAARTDTDLRTKEVSEVIAGALAQRGDSDAELGSAIRPIVEKQFHKATRDNVELMADALFPVIGPAVRKLVYELISPSEEGDERHVEQVFLIDNPSGLPIAHVHAENAAVQDAEMVSGMLTAIKSYVNDAFSAQAFDGLDHIRVGELAIWIEWGPHAVLAAVVRGNGTDSVRTRMQEILEAIHKDFGETIRSYNGSEHVSEKISESLSHLLSSTGPAAKKRGLSRRAKRLSLAFVVLMAAIASLAYTIFDSARWSGYVNQLESEPGLIVLSSNRGFRGYQVTGLRDPLAANPREFLQHHDIDPQRIVFHWSPVASLHPDIVLQRVTRALDPPEDVNLSIRGQTLIITGRASEEWYAHAKRLALATPGIEWVQAPTASLF